MKHSNDECTCHVLDLQHMLIHVDGKNTNETCISDITRAVEQALTTKRGDEPPLFEQVRCIAFPLDEKHDGYITYYLHQISTFLRLIEPTKYTRNITLGPGLDLLQRGYSWLKGHVEAVEMALQQQKELNAALKEQLIKTLKNTDFRTLKLDKDSLLALPLTLLQKIAAGIGAPIEPLDNATVIVDKILAVTGTQQKGTAVN